MTVPGVGAVVALTFRAADDATRLERFSAGKVIGPCFGLTPGRYQSGETDRTGTISRTGDPAVWVALFEAAHVLMTRVARWSNSKLGPSLDAGAKRAKVALARKIAVVLRRMWVDGTISASPIKTRGPIE